MTDTPDLRSKVQMKAVEEQERIVESTAPEIRFIAKELTKSEVSEPKPHANAAGLKLVWFDALSSAPLLVGDLAAVILCSFVTMAFARFCDVAWFPGPNSVLALVVLVPMTFGVMKLYPATLVYPSEELRRIAIGLTPVFSALAAALWARGEGWVPHVTLRAFQFLSSVILVWVIRLLCRRLLAKSTWWNQPIHVAGYGRNASRLEEWLRRQWYAGVRAVPHNQEACHLLIDSIGTIPDQLEDEASHLRSNYPRVFVADVSQPGSCVILRFEYQNRLLLPSYWLLKRTIDLGIVACTLLFWLPILVVLAVAIRSTSQGPVFFFQNRVGYRGKTFRAWKLRSMVMNAEEVLEECLLNDSQLAEEWMTGKKLKIDPRVTKLGRILRKTSLDELPQLINVIRGEMSLVGPRPIPVYEAEQYGNVERDYGRVMPGITGLWQVMGRNDTTYDDRVMYDSYYVRNWSPWLDFGILIRTLKTVLLREGAY